MHTDVAKIGAPSRTRNKSLNKPLSQRTALGRTEHPIASEVPMLTQSGGSVHI